MSFTSGEYGLPTFGASGTQYPNDTSGDIVPSGDNSTTSFPDGSSFDYLRPNTLYYFEPGVHTSNGNPWQVYANDSFVGGYSPTLGPAVIYGSDNTANGDGAISGDVQGSSFTSGADVSLEYLTITDWSSNQDDAVLNGSVIQPGWTIEHDTIGPNLDGPGGANASNNSTMPGQTQTSGQASGGGYAMNLGTHSTVEYNCVTQDSQGGVNIGGNYPAQNGPSGASGACMNGNATGPGCWLNQGTVVSYNEFSYNGLGDYPDPCGCVANAGKFFYTLNLQVTHNYIHNGYGTGIWGDTNNAGANVSDNYISNNWGGGVDYESSYNASIANNVILDNGWAATGPWPACTYDPSYDCTVGAGVHGGGLGSVPYAAIYLPNDGGSSLIPSAYSGHMYVTGNDLVNNYSGILQYNDDSRYAGPVEDYQGSQCDQPLQGWSSTYYSNFNEERDTNATISGTTLSTGDSGFQSGVCPDYYQLSTLSSPLSTSGTVTSLSVGATADALPSGATIKLAYGSYTQTWTVSGAVAASSAALAVSGQTPNFPYPAGTSVIYEATANRNYVTANPFILCSSCTWYAFWDGMAGGPYRVTSCASAISCTLASTPTGTLPSDAYVVLSTPGGCGLYDLYGATGPGQTGSPAADYWSNCIWGAFNTQVTGNTETLDSSTVYCPTNNEGCGINGVMYSAPGLNTLWEMYEGSSLSDDIQEASGAGSLGNVWSGNTYQFSGSGGYGGWIFVAGDQSSYFATSTVSGTQSAWLGFGQDAGSTMNAGSF
jgi:hypothetical protein